jgi:putative aldouronate transport system substrate-binding protein
MKKKLVAALMASVMCLSMLAGCGNNEDNPSGSSPSTPGSTTPSNSTPGSTTPGGSEPSATADPNAFEQTWPDGQVITWMVRDDNATADETRYSQLIAIEKIEEMFHVDIQFITMSGKDQAGEEKGAAAARYVAMMSDVKNLPDVVGYMHNDTYKEKGGISGLYNDGVCVELNDLIETKIPNLKKIFEEHPDIAKDMADSEGRYLYLQRINPYLTERDYISATTTGLVMRQDWLDAVDMDVPKNMDEWTEVLKAFKTMDPNGNNQNDEIPFNAYSSGIQMFEAAYGMIGGIYIDPDTGKVEHGARTQKYKEYLTKMNEWYTDGLMDLVFDEKGNAVSKGGDDLVTGDLAGSWKGLSNNDTKFADVMRTDGGKPDTKFVAVPWPATADGTVYSQRGVSRLQKNTVIVTTNCAKDPKKMDAVAAIFNYMLSEEGSLLLTWGEENVTFTTDDHGVRTLTEYGNEQIEVGSSKPQRYKMYGNQSDCLVSYGNFDIDTATRDAWYNESATIWATANFDLIYPASITLTADQTARIGDSQLATYIAEMKWKFITGQEPLANFDTYLAELERLGISNMVAVYQEAYDAYKAP